jgi:hypothetical protein
MAKGSRRKALLGKKLAKKARMKAGGMESNYAKKRRYLDTHGGWGDLYPEPKPWKGKK